jgi:hypothetical protein
LAWERLTGRRFTLFCRGQPLLLLLCRPVEGLGCVVEKAEEEVLALPAVAAYHHADV